MRGLVSLIVLFLCAVAVAAAGESASNSTATYATDSATADKDFRCGWQVDGRMCADGRCCSQFGYCGSNAAYCSHESNCQSLCWTPEGGASNVIAYFHHYDAEENNWNLTAAGVACAKYDGDKSNAWRSKYGWTAFCGPVGPKDDEAACGKCIRVINNATKAEETVRVVEGCTSDGFVLDYEVFKRLDTDGEGSNKGYFFVDYHFVECGPGFDLNNDKIVIRRPIDSA